MVQRQSLTLNGARNNASKSTFDHYRQSESLTNTQLWKTWLRRYRTRRQLRNLLLLDPERLARDLGISVDCARAECKKPFWR